MASTEEFKIKTEVEIDTKSAEAKLKNFTDPKNSRKIPVEIKLKENDKALESDLKSLGKSISRNLTISPGSIEGFQKLEKSLNNMKSTLKDMEGLLGKDKLHIIDSEVLDPKIFTKSIKTLENFVKKVEKKFDDLDKAKNKFGGQSTSGKPLEVDVDIEKAQYKLEKFGNKVDLLRYKFNNLDLNIVGVGNVEKIENRLDSLYQKARKNAFSGKPIMTPDVDLEMKNLREMLNLLRKVQTQFNNFQNIRVNLGDNVDVDSLNKVEHAFKEIFDRITSMDDLSLGFNADALLHSLRNVNRELNQSKEHFSSVKRIASDFKNEIASYTIGEALGEVTVDFARDIGRAYIELDRSMRDIKKVAAPQDIDTVDKLQNIRREAISVAKDVGMSSSDVQQSIASALQAGIGGMKESIEVAKQSMILANVGDMTQDAASKAINTVVKSFRLDPLKEFQIEVGNTKQKTTELKNAMDLMNYAGNNFAIGTDGIAEAMRRGGSVLASYNVSLQDSVGLITATNEALQDPARVGNGLKTIAINLAGMKASAKDGSIDMNKTAMALKQIAGVDVFEDKKTGKLKNMVQVLDEVQNKWGQLTDAQQKALSESIAGKLICQSIKKLIELIVGCIGQLDCKIKVVREPKSYKDMVIPRVVISNTICNA